MDDAALYVLAGVNGSGKSSVGGAAITARGLTYYNPDRAANQLRQLHPGMTQALANSHAWMLGKELLEKAIAQRETYALETTLGGQTITDLLLRAAQAGMPVKLWYVGLATVELNLARIQARVARGGHAIPETLVRKRWDSSRRNLIRLLPRLHSLRVYDNSHEADPHEGHTPLPELLLHVEARRIVQPPGPGAPEWACPILAGALHAFAQV